MILITKEMVREGYKDGIVSLIKSPNGDGIAARIGDGWIYFGGVTAEEHDSVESYTAAIPEETIIEAIFTTLHSFGVDGQFDPGLYDEYEYYAAVFKEHEKAKKAVKSDEPEEVPAETLTAGLLRELIGERNIPALKSLVCGKKEDDVLDVVDLNDYLAYKLWTRMDVEERLSMHGLPCSPAYVDEVINNGNLDSLGDCTDREWNMFEEAIHTAEANYALPRAVTIKGPFTLEEIMEIPFDFEKELPMTVCESISEMDMTFETGDIYIASATYGTCEKAHATIKLYAIKYEEDSCWEVINTDDNNL